jgi:hypothetical protein
LVCWFKRDALIENLRRNLGQAAFEHFTSEIGEPFEERLTTRLKAFAEPRQALISEVGRIRGFAYLPSDVTVLGLLYELSTGAVEVVVSGTD